MWASLIVIQSEGASNAVTAVISTCRNDTLTRVPPTLGFRFHKASRQAWNRLIALCCAGNKKLYKSEAGIHSIYEFTYALDRTCFSNGLFSLNNTPHCYLGLPIYSHLGPLCTLLELGSFLNKPVHRKEFHFPVFVPFPPLFIVPTRQLFPLPARLLDFSFSAKTNLFQDPRQTRLVKSGS